MRAHVRYFIIIFLPTNSIKHVVLLTSDPNQTTERARSCQEPVIIRKGSGSVTTSNNHTINNEQCINPILLPTTSSGTMNPSTGSSA